ncbi:hypothetical protein DPMN_107707 [Dreissena polymorpha]|uniref:Uncharacterized protein n=1 Tax=Dreissena polymorpha TaxID=45954 RepID=A0A9D4K7H5_DREPO|nr:hypothetical protein DPMN_107707 [Dreissena polymorpha]
MSHVPYAASIVSDKPATSVQELRCPLQSDKVSWPNKQTGKLLTRLGECTGRSGALLPI